VRQVNSAKLSQGLGVIDRIFHAFVRQIVPVLQQIQPQHFFTADGRTTAFSHGTNGFNQGQPFFPWHLLFHLVQKLIPACLALLSAVFQFTERGLMIHLDLLRIKSFFTV
jgi:hypothetical protein